MADNTTRMAMTRVAVLAKACVFGKKLHSSPQCPELKGYATMACDTLVRSCDIPKREAGSAAHLSGFLLGPYHLPVRGPYRAYGHPCEGLRGTCAGMIE